jgi:Na+/melibiose symporter-like transporter
VILKKLFFLYLCLSSGLLILAVAFATGAISAHWFGIWATALIVITFVVNVFLHTKARRPLSVNEKSSDKVVTATRKKRLWLVWMLRSLIVLMIFSLVVGAVHCFRASLV